MFTCWSETLSNLLHQGLRQPNMRAQAQDGNEKGPPSSLGPSVSWGARGYKQPFPPGGEDSRASESAQHSCYYSVLVSFLTPGSLTPGMQEVRYKNRINLNHGKDVNQCLQEGPLQKRRKIEFWSLFWLKALQSMSPPV